MLKLEKRSQILMQYGSVRAKNLNLRRLGSHRRGRVSRLDASGV
ncbi:MAG: hypothetical protein RMY34_30900 [Aulosira sp. DedQUE10]|nr:hypothetical protein [Aulosira sp. DedQUE10]